MGLAVRSDSPFSGILDVFLEFLKISVNDININESILRTPLGIHITTPPLFSCVFSLKATYYPGFLF